MDISHHLDDAPPDVLADFGKMAVWFTRASRADLIDVADLLTKAQAVWFESANTWREAGNAEELRKAMGVIAVLTEALQDANHRCGVTPEASRL